MNGTRNGASAIGNPLYFSLFAILSAILSTRKSSSTRVGIFDFFDDYNHMYRPETSKNQSQFLSTARKTLHARSHGKMDFAYAIATFQVGQYRVIPFSSSLRCECLDCDKSRPCHQTQPERFESRLCRCQLKTCCVIVPDMGKEEE